MNSIAREKKMLYFVFFALGVLSLYRAYHLWQTGFLVSDEYGNIVNAREGIVYGNRFFFYWVNIILFRLLPLNNINNLVFFLPFYLFLWSGLTVFLFFKVMKNLEFDGRTITLSLFSSLFLVAFLLLSLGFLTEPMGLAIIMLGIYFFVKFAKSKRLYGLPVYSSLAALAVSAAYYVRQPYAIFMIGGLFVVLIIALNAPSRFDDPRSKKLGIIVASMLLFFVIVFIFLFWPIDVLGDIRKAAFGFAETVATPFVTSTTTLTSQVQTTTVSTISARTVSTISHITLSNGSVITTIVTITVPPQTTIVTFTQLVIQESHNILLDSRLFNTLWIFFGGLGLGWGPVLIVLGTIGFLTLLRKAHTKDPNALFILVLCLLALASYLGVSYIFSDDPTYLSFAHYSTIIRFSDTALPAYFLAAPFALSVIARKRKHVIAVVAILLVFSIGGVQVYQVYAASGLHIEGNPFALDYRAPGALMRDYFVSHQDEAPFYVMSNDKNPLEFTPGTTALESVHFLPYLSEQEFVKNRWTTFYVWGTNVDSTVKQAPYLTLFLKQDAQLNQSSNQVGQVLNGSAIGGYDVTTRQVILNGTGFFLVRVQLSWGNAG